MGLFSGIFLGMVLGIALMAAWQRMMTYRSAKRIAKCMSTPVKWSQQRNMIFASANLFAAGDDYCCLLPMYHARLWLDTVNTTEEAVDIKLLGSLNRDDLKKICGDNFPEWISFPVYEQVKWLNKQLSKLWPFVADAATLVIRESVEPILEEYRPAGISSLKFSKLSLGNVAPKIEETIVETKQQIESHNPIAFAPKIVQPTTDISSNMDDENLTTPSSARHKSGCNYKRSMCLKKYCECYQANVGCSSGCQCEGCNVHGKKEDYVAFEHTSSIRVQSLNKGQIIMDIDFRWGGDPNIVLAVEALVASIPIQLKDLQVFTIIRVIFQLADEIPCISAVVVALLAEPKPRIDYTLKAVGGSLTALPGISDMIDDMVNTIVTDTLQWPHRIVVPLGGIPVDTSELELKPQGTLRATVIKANDLKNMEMIGKSDPYAVLYIRPLFKVKTKVIDNNLNPVWNEVFDLIAEDKETQSLIVEVFDKDIGQDKRLGIVKLPLNDLEPETEKEFELRLLSSLDTLKVKDKKDRGTITIKIFYHQFNKEEQLVALEAEKNILEERKKLKEEGVIGTTMDALDGAASAVGSGVGMVGTGAGLVGTGIGAGAGLVGTGIGAGAGLVGSGIGVGAGLVGSGIGAGVGFVGSGLGAVGSGLSRAGKFMGRTITGQGSSRRSGSNTPVNVEETGGGAKPLQDVGVLESNEGVRRFTEESAKSHRNTVNVAAAELECGREPLFDDGGSGHDNDRDFSSGDLDGVDRCCDWNWFRGK
ncbi:hypothetical protein JHK86_051155 [Glycine max]|nr:hypothetical protein JHK86_051155 [Glycine max]